MASNPSQECLQSRTILWCVPRTISTAFTKCLSAIEDIQVWFEPYTWCQMGVTKMERCTDEKLPSDYIGNEDAYQCVIDLLKEETSCLFKPESISYSSVTRQLEMATNAHVFIKDMTYKSEKQLLYLPKSYKHTFMIRHPLRTINSYRTGNMKFGSIRSLDADEEKLYDVEQDAPYFEYFHENQYALWKFVRENIDSNPIVMDSDEFLANPAEMLSKYCRAVGLPFSESLLKWDASTDVLKSWKVPSEDIWEPYGPFFDTSTKSSEFFPGKEMPLRTDVTPDVIRYTDHQLKYYEEMYEHRI